MRAPRTVEALLVTAAIVALAGCAHAPRTPVATIDLDKVVDLSYSFGADTPGFENLANVDRLPASGATLVALPIKIAGGSGGPARVIAILP